MTDQSQDILLSKITKLLQDLRADGTDNGEAMFLLGSAAAELCNAVQMDNWRQYKASLNTADIIDLLQQIDAEGNRLLNEDKVTFAYALQVIGMSLAAGSSDDPRLRHGAGFLDDIIETTLTNYRAYIQTRPQTTN